MNNKQKNLFRIIGVIMIISIILTAVLPILTFSQPAGS